MAKNQRKMTENRLIGIAALLFGFLWAGLQAKWPNMQPWIPNTILTVALVLSLYWAWDMAPDKWKTPGKARALMTVIGIAAFLSISSLIWWSSPSAQGLTPEQNAILDRAIARIHAQERDDAQNAPHQLAPESKSRHQHQTRNSIL
jgi:hypothetical protein